MRRNTPYAFTELGVSMLSSILTSETAVCINDWGWDLGKIQPMDTEDGITYTITVKIWADNDFKFLCQNDGWFPDYVRDKNASDYFTVIKRESADAGIEDAAFRLDTQGMESANYKITLNVQTCKLTLEKH